MTRKERSMVAEPASRRREHDRRSSVGSCRGAVLLRRTCLVAALLVASVTLGPSAVSAQRSLVVQAGAGLGDLWGTPEDLPKESRVSARAEAALLWALSPNVGLQVGAGYVREAGTESGFGFDYTLTVDFIQVPVLARFGLGREGARFSPHALLGPTVSFTAGCEIRRKTISAPQLDVSGCDEGVVELGALAALGLDTRLSGPAALTLELIHARVLTPVDARRLKSWSLVAGIRWDLR